MGAQLRVYRRRIRSVQSTKKITRAMELIAASRIAKAQQRVEAAKPYSEAVTRAVSAVASQASVVDHPLTTDRKDAKRVAVLVVTSDRGLAGGYNANALKAAEELSSLLRREGKEPVPYLVGRKSVAYYSFRQRDIAARWTGFSEQPGVQNALEVTERLLADFVAGSGGEGAELEDGSRAEGVDEIHVVYTEFESALIQRPKAVRVLPLVVEQADAPPPDGPLPLYEFEPSPEAVLDALLPKYVSSRVYAAFLQAAASESASRRRAMKAATDNADELVKTLTRMANSARQAEITQEISEIVGGADALAASGSDAQ